LAEAELYATLGEAVDNHLFLLTRAATPDAEECAGLDEIEVSRLAADAAYRSGALDRAHSSAMIALGAGYLAAARQAVTDSRHRRHGAPSRRPGGARRSPTAAVVHRLGSGMVPGLEGRR
jgi:hypothetical protein